MTRDEELMWGAAAVLLGLAFWQRKAIVTTVSDVVSRGSRLTHSPVGPDGLVPDDPGTLAAAAAAALGRPVSQDAYDLARMIRSEGAAEGLIRGHVALNDAKAHGWSLHFALTYSTNAQAKGMYGAQYTPPSAAPGGTASVRRYSTAQDPYEGDVTIAEQVLAEDAAGIDPSGGAVKFYDVNSGQVGAASYDQVVAQWAPLVPSTVDGYPDSFVVFRPVA